MNHPLESAIDRELSAHKLGKATEHAIKSAQDAGMAVQLRQQAGLASSSAGTGTSTGAKVGMSSGTDVAPNAGGRAGSSTGSSGNTASDDETEDGDSTSTAK
jgi:hypothetical protein